MNVPYRWLTDLVDTGLPASELAHKLTMAGLEAEKITQIGAGWDKVYVAEVMAVSQHPDADRLVLADVAAADHRLTVVTGAPNIAKGQKVALALAGARLIDAYADELKYKTLKPGSIRGVRSEGMVCSEKELGLSNEHEGILVLDNDAPVGVPLADYLGDTVIEFEITPNLVHAFSILGIAREASALTGAEVKPLDLVELSTVEQVDDLVHVDAPDRCARFAALVIEGIEVAPSPMWITRRLTAAGIRPINNIVDVTNYIMIEVGQPLHAYDLRFVHGERIGVRRSRAGERLETIDHQVRELPGDTLLIVDAEKPLGLAGIMGGVNSEIVDSTTSILLEAANFDMTSIRSTSRALKLRTDASARFERGIDPELVGLALGRAASLILAVCPAARLVRMQDVYTRPVQPRTVTLPTAKVDAVLGIHIDPGEMVDVLTRLGFTAALSDSDATLVVSVPSWRSDVWIAEDVIEEIARIVGYERLPATLPTGTSPHVERDPGFLAEREIRRVMVAAGAFEGRGYVTLSQADLDRWAISSSSGLAHDVQAGSLVCLRNAVQADYNILRPSILPGLVKSVAENLKHERTVRLFEIGHVYLATGPDSLPDEPVTLGIAFAGRRERFDRFHPARDADGDLDFFDVKGAVEAVLSTMGTSGAAWERLIHPTLHPGRAASLALDRKRIGAVAEVRPDLARLLGVEDVRLVVGELNVDALLKLRSTSAPQVSVDRFLPVEQDFAIVVDQHVPASDVESALKSGAGPLLSSIVLFDVFAGEQLGEAKKSLAYRLTFTAPDRALTDAELGKVRKRIERTIDKEIGGTLRA
jgi:phenylalanyl-tRNA synthetase beta chain